jgi:hypothetical protein
MLRRLGLALAYLIAFVYIVLILLPSVYCLQHGCKGAGEGDAFMPAFFFIPLGAMGTAFSLYNSIQNIRRGSLPWVFWPLAVLFAAVLLGIAAFVILMVFELATHR